ncbi:unnamed protein product [Notodromas monacha]|uniref:Uncharacterized protein n=1 Tax=Notodromas monacha TaxID=399045 RepID=A0A7R9BJQ7_9CRUS|nr:unnamed protein product [Notodromas monacha]CAG0915633.1 unnamed protein product [Notodromas monacha]
MTTQWRQAKAALKKAQCELEQYKSCHQDSGFNNQHQTVFEDRNSAESAQKHGDHNNISQICPIVTSSFNPDASLKNGKEDIPQSLCDQITLADKRVRQLKAQHDQCYGRVSRESSSMN